MIQQSIRIPIAEADQKSENETVLVEPDFDHDVVDITVGRRTFAVELSDLMEAVALIGFAKPAAAQESPE